MLPEVFAGVAEPAAPPASGSASSGGKVTCSAGRPSRMTSCSEPMVAATTRNAAPLSGSSFMMIFSMRTAAARDTSTTTWG